MLATALRWHLDLHHNLAQAQSDPTAGFWRAIRWGKVLMHPTSVTSKWTASNSYLTREPPLFAGHYITRNHRQIIFLQNSTITFSSTKLRKITLQHAEPWTGKGTQLGGRGLLFKLYKTIGSTDIHYLQICSWLCSLKALMLFQVLHLKKILLP